MGYTKLKGGSWLSIFRTKLYYFTHEDIELEYNNSIINGFRIVKLVKL